jgi:hypothetical protein
MEITQGMSMKDYYEATGQSSSEEFKSRVKADVAAIIEQNSEQPKTRNVSESGSGQGSASDEHQK